MQIPTQEQTENLLATIEPDPAKRRTTAAQIQKHLFVDATGGISVNAAGNSIVRQATRDQLLLPTRISAPAFQLLGALQELFDAGLVTASGVHLHAHDANSVEGIGA